ncbi:MAG: hypothetical protein K0Q60_3487 [Microvirga sp.]|nr:hypothetical protein [Microvirga sp.]
MTDGERRMALLFIAAGRAIDSPERRKREAAATVLASVRGTYDRSMHTIIQRKGA